MPIVLKKLKAQAAPVTQKQFADPLSDLSELIDQCGKLAAEAELVSARIKAETKKLDPYKKALALLQEKLEKLGVDADDLIERSGGVYDMTAGVKGTSRSIKDLPVIRFMLGEKTFMELASVKLGDLDKYLTVPQLNKVLETTRTARAIKFTRKPA